MTGPLACIKSPGSSNVSWSMPSCDVAASRPSTVSDFIKSCTCPLISRRTINASLPNLRMPMIRPTTVTSVFSSASNELTTAAQSCVRALSAGYGLTPNDFKSLSLRTLSSRSSFRVAICISVPKTITRREHVYYRYDKYHNFNRSLRDGIRLHSRHR